MLPLLPLERLLPADASLVLIKDLGGRMVYNAFMAATPHHPAAVRFSARGERFAVDHQSHAHP